MAWLVDRCTCFAVYLMTGETWGKMALEHKIHELRLFPISKLGTKKPSCHFRFET
jgi:hypothetical protein